MRSLRGLFPSHPDTYRRYNQGVDTLYDVPGGKWWEIDTLISNGQSATLTCPANLLHEPVALTRASFYIANNAASPAGDDYAFQFLGDIPQAGRQTLLNLPGSQIKRYTSGDFKLLGVNTLLCTINNTTGANATFKLGVMLRSDFSVFADMFQALIAFDDYLQARIDEADEEIP